ncbi:MAG TPA: hypothetical protein VK604_06895 [Bryobacteraceae bacterium]|nr:hypothetical protein [Bryobacteraceae bacterium]
MADSRFIVMTCAKCNTEIGLLTFHRAADIKRTTATPEKCPASDALFDQCAQENIDLLRTVYENVLKRKSFTVTFRAKEEMPT